MLQPKLIEAGQVLPEYVRHLDVHQALQDGHPLLVGEAPGGGAFRSPNAVGSALYPLPTGRAGSNLQRTSGLSVGQYLRAFLRINVLDAYPGSRWPKEAASLAWAARVAHLVPGRTCILLGRNVAQAAGLDDYEWFQPIVPEGMGARTMLVVLPHPSGRNRLWNDKANRQKAKLVLQRAAKGFCHELGDAP